MAKHFDGEVEYEHEDVDPSRLFTIEFEGDTGTPADFRGHIDNWEPEDPGELEITRIYETLVCGCNRDTTEAEFLAITGKKAYDVVGRYIERQR